MTSIYPGSPDARPRPVVEQIFAAEWGPIVAGAIAAAALALVLHSFELTPHALWDWRKPVRRS
jgi:hypothetical protein